MAALGCALSAAVAGAPLGLALRAASLRSVARVIPERALPAEHWNFGQRNQYR
jgi:hypothetical protein